MLINMTNKSAKKSIITKILEQLHVFSCYNYNETLLETFYLIQCYQLYKFVTMDWLAFALRFD